MYKTLKFSLLTFVLFFILTSCEKQIDYGPDIELLKSEVASLKNSIKDLTSQLNTLESSLKSKIDQANAKIDSINTTVKSIDLKALSTLTSDILTINNSIKNSNIENTRRLDSIRNVLIQIEASLGKTGQSITSLNDAYNNILSNYVEILKIIKSTLTVIELNGAVFKGSFLRGSLLHFYELDSNLSQTGRSFNATIKDDYGNFNLRAQNLAGKLVRLVGDGFYWNEVLNENSSSRITLTALCKIDSNEIVNVNVLTHIERPRVEYLYNVKGLSFDSAKSKAVSEVLNAFGLENPGIKRSEKVNVVGFGDDSKILLALSTMIQGYRTESEVTQILSDIAQDLEVDGTLSDNSIGNDIETHLYYSDTALILNNFKIKYRKLYDIEMVNSLDMRFIKLFQENTAYTKDKDLIEFPEFERSGRYKNILFEGNTIFTGQQFGVSCVLSRKGIKLKVEVLNEDGSPLDGLGFGFPIGTQLGWEVARTAFYIPTYSSTGLGIHDITTGYNDFKVYRVNFYERGFTVPSKVKYITLSE